MAGSVPPPPWTPHDARAQARQAKYAARAQRREWKAQARAQKYYYRSYWRGMRRPSFVGPLVLLAIGIIAMLMTTGRLDPPEFWSWYARWWPILLIGLGVLLLGEYLLDRNSPGAGRRSAGGLVWLVILMIVLGWITREGHLVGPFSWQFDGDGNNNFWSWMGPEHDNDVHIDQTLAGPNASITITNPRGDVTLSPSTDGQLHIQAHEMVHRGSAKEAQRIFDELKPNVAVAGSSAVITVPEKTGSEVDLTITVPPSSLVAITASNGDVTAGGLGGAVQITSRQGDIKLADIGGDATAHMSHGDFSAHNIRGQVLVDGQGDDLTLSSVQGSATMNGEFFGDVHLEQVGGAIRFHSSRTTVEIPHLDGSLTLDESDLSVKRATGPIRVIARSKDIDLSRIAGDVHVEDSDGDVNLVAVAPVGNVQIADHTGNVVLTMPQSAGFTVTGSTSEDEAIRTDFPLNISKSGARQTLSGTVGNGGVQLELNTDHGNLELRKGTDESLVTLPSPAKQASIPVRHFHAPVGQKLVVDQQ